MFSVVKKLICSLLLLFVGVSVFAQSSTISVADIWSKGTFSTKSAPEIQSLQDGKHYCLMDKDGVKVFKYSNGKEGEPLCLFSKVRGCDTLSFRSFVVDETESYILFSANVESIYRYSRKADYYLYDIDAGKLKKLTNDGKQSLTTFSPDGTKVAYVRDNDLYYMDLSNLKEHRITKDGKKGKIINGTTDWVYEEEFSITRGFQWSPDSRRIAYYRFDESKVKQYTIQKFGTLYPEEYKYKYPKAGEENSKVEIYIYDLVHKNKISPSLGSEDDQYLPRFQWTKDPGTLCIMRMNRLQNLLEIKLVDVAANTVRPLYNEKCNTYVEVPTTCIFLKDGDHFIINSEKDGYNHLYLGNMAGTRLDPITSGNYDVESVCAVDEKNQKIYFTAHRTSPINTDLFVTNYFGQKTQRLGAPTGTYNASFSNTCQYYLCQYSSANVAPVYTICDADGRTLRTIEDNAALQERMQRYGACRKTFGVLTTSRGTELNYYLILPENFDANKRHPILFYVYGGPGDREVCNAYEDGNYYWFHMLAQKGYVVACFDGRGTGGRGADFKKQTYKRLGEMECEDAIDAARWFSRQDWIDPSRIGIFGWSFGGYLSTLAILKGNNVFKTAIAVAPVISWRYYDNIYTERFLQRPDDNPEGYDNNSPLNFASRLKGNYLLIHGTADDNVHVQNSYDMATALQEAGKQFDFRVYPNKNHSIYGGNTRENLYDLMTDFILRKL